MKIQNALLSVFDKTGLDALAPVLHEQGVVMYSTGGTYQHIVDMGLPVEKVEDLTQFPAILGGRVKTLHPKIFGGILWRRDNEHDALEVETHEIPTMDLVVVDLYPFTETLQSGAEHQEIIEKIDIGGVSLLRAAAKNYAFVTVLSHHSLYSNFIETLKNTGETTKEYRRELAGIAFGTCSEYDTTIGCYIRGEKTGLTVQFDQAQDLRYGENPHQEATFFGHLEDILEVYQGKAMSYNNLLDVDTAVRLIEEFEESTCGIFKHNNPCGVATDPNPHRAWDKALECDPVSAFGGVIVFNTVVDETLAKAINTLFFEVLIAEEFTEGALAVFAKKPKKIIARKKARLTHNFDYRSALNGVLKQQRDQLQPMSGSFTSVTDVKPTEEELVDLEFAMKVAKHTKSNTIVLAKGKRLISSGVGQTSRIDALHQAIEKAKRFKFDVKGAAMASDAFFPFPDCVEVAFGEGIRSVVQPGGSIKDQLSIDYCNSNGIAMVFTGIRHFKH